MTKSLQQIKDQVAQGDDFHDWDDLFESCAMYDYGRLEEGIDQVAVRYANEQNRELQDWKTSASKILNNIDLQKLGKLLGMQFGTAIDEQLLPHVTKLVDQNRELVEMLESVVQLQKDHYGNGGSTRIALSLKAKEINQLITKHKQS